MSVLFEFLEFIEAGPRPAVHDLLHRVLLKSRKLTGAVAGSIFILRRRGRKKMLEIASLQNDFVDVPPASLTVPVDGSSIAGYVALTGNTVRLDDVRKISAGRRFRFNDEADRRTGFQTKSILCFPLKNYAGEVIGVVQLINRHDETGNGPLPFTAEHAAIIHPIHHFVGGAIERAEMIERISEQNRRLTQRNRALFRQRRQIGALKDQTEEAFKLSIRLLARAAELHDKDTGNHIVRVNEYSCALAKALDMPEAFCDEIRYSAQLHDIGKMSVDQAVLKKKGKLTAAERAEMDRHPEYGHRILVQSDRLKMAAEIALCHHEKWDGSGYPRGLKGEAIPIAARIVQLADVYDALRAPRPYKPGLPHDETCRIILDGDEQLDPKAHFDPRLLESFYNYHKELDHIWRRIGE
ncbi:MAG: HD domain-containing protein [Rhodospirillales bacterium]|nr:HD domain-containing protein [Rhodospirillales bacterium]